MKRHLLMVAALELVVFVVRKTAFSECALQGAKKTED
jgi:hypothetical protein